MRGWEQTKERIAGGAIIRELIFREVILDQYPQELLSMPIEMICFEDVSFPEGVPWDLLSLPTLKEIRLSFVYESAEDWDQDKGKISDLSDQWKVPEGLKILDLSGNNFLDFPPQISQMAELISLEMSENALNLPLKGGLPPGLKELDLSYNPLEEPPKVIASLQRLIRLDLSQCSLRTWPEYMGDCGSLQTLILSHNQGIDLTHFSPKGLFELSLENCQLRTWKIPKTLGLGLKKLHLGHNHLSLLDSTIGDLKHLKHLNLEGNQLIKLPQSLGKLGELEVLKLKDNPLKDLPRGLSGLVSLRYLDIGGGKYQDFPKVIMELRTLETLLASHNHFYQIFPGIKDLHRLKVLNLHKAYVLFIAKELALLDLEKLDLSYNPIKNIPPLGKMNHLKAVNLSGLNELEDPEEQLLTLTQNPSIELLSLQNTKAWKFALLFKNHKRLKRINLGFPEMSEAQKQEIKESLDPKVVWIPRSRR